MGRPKGGTNKIWTTEEKIRIVNRYLNNEVLSRAVLAAYKEGETVRVPRGTVIKEVLYWC